MEKYTVPYVVIFIPAYNEESAIASTIKDILEKNTGKNQKDFIIDIVVINDGSKDNTKKVAQEAGAKKVISNSKNKGLGAATRAGMQTAFEMGADIACKVDGDSQFDAADIQKIVHPIINDDADCVFGSRFLDKKKYYGTELHKAWGNKFFSWFVSILISQKITDGQTGFMAFHRRYLKIFNIVSDYNETQQLMIDAWAKKMRLKEIAVKCEQRKSGKSFISWKYPLKVGPNMLRLYIQVKPLHVFIPTGLILLILGITSVIAILAKPNLPYGSGAIAILFISSVLIISFGFLSDQITNNRNK